MGLSYLSIACIITSIVLLTVVGFVLMREAYKDMDVMHKNQLKAHQRRWTPLVIYVCVVVISIIFDDTLDAYFANEFLNWKKQSMSVSLIVMFAILGGWNYLGVRSLGKELPDRSRKLLTLGSLISFALFLLVISMHEFFRS